MKITVGPYECSTESYVPTEHRVIYDALLFFNENVDHINRASGGGTWDGYASMYELRGGKGKFKTGFLERILSNLTEANVYFEITDNRMFPKPYLDVGETTLVLRPYQQKILDDISREPNGRISACCGAGKTFQSLSLHVTKLKVRTLVIVDRLLLLNQNYNNYKEISPNSSIGRIGGGHCQLDKDLTVAIINTVAGRLKKKDKAMIDYIKNVEAIITDECHVGTSKSFVEVMSLAKTGIRYGMSGTLERRSEEANLVCEGLYGPIRSFTWATELMEEGFLSNVGVTFVSIDFPDNARMSGIRSRKEAYERGVVHNYYRNQKICSIADGFLKFGDKSVVIFKYRPHGEAILEVFNEELPHIRVGFMNGTTSMKDRDAIIEGYKSGSIDIILSSFIFSTGIDIPSIPSLIYAGGGKPESSLVQIMGRLSRVAEGKKMGIMVDFEDNINVELKADSEERRKIVLSEPGYEIIENKA